jgi:hypothetical protein
MLLCTITLRWAAAAAFAALIALAPGAVVPGLARDTAYLADVDDMPLAPGLVEDPAGRVAFDKPEGRIVEAVADGAVSVGAVEAFYDGALPALGWSRTARGEWTRGSERLEIRIERDGAGVRTRFSIAPR